MIEHEVHHKGVTGQAVPVRQLYTGSGFDHRQPVNAHCLELLLKVQTPTVTQRHSDAKSVHRAGNFLRRGLEQRYDSTLTSIQAPRPQPTAYKHEPG